VFCCCCFPTLGARPIFRRDLLMATPTSISLAELNSSFDPDMLLRLRPLQGWAVGRTYPPTRRFTTIIVRCGVRPKPSQTLEVVLLPEAEHRTVQFRVMWAIHNSFAHGSREFACLRCGSVSPDDIAHDAGGGVAYRLLESAGREVILTELASFVTDSPPANVLPSLSGGAPPGSSLVSCAHRGRTNPVCLRTS